MILEGGSQNASRIPGHYAYPVHRYRSDALEAVSRVPGNAFPRVDRPIDAARKRDRQELFHPELYEMRRPAAGARQNAAELARELAASRETPSSYANSAFRARPDTTENRGLFVNLLG